MVVFHAILNSKIVNNILYFWDTSQSRKYLRYRPSGKPTIQIRHVALLEMSLASFWKDM